MLHLRLATCITSLSLGLSDVLGIRLPKPRGPFDVGITTFQLTDHTRLDPFAPTPQNRSIQLSVHYPISSNSQLPFAAYLPFLTADATEVQIGAPAGSLQNITAHAHLDAPILNGGRNAPIVLFSPGSTASRLVYTTFVQNLASEGYAVISIDHPHDATIVELSDGQVITRNISDTPEGTDLAVAVRAADARFILDEIATGHNFKVPGLAKGILNASHVGFFGHSLGDATAATAMVFDRRIVCGVNMDGAFQGPDVRRGFSKPFVIMESEGHNRTTDPSWAEVWPKLRGFKREIKLNGSVHITYTDGPVLGDLLGLNVGGIFGNITGSRVDEIQHAYLTAFFDFALNGKRERLLDGPSEQFPEVTFDPQV